MSAKLLFILAALCTSTVWADAPLSRAQQDAATQVLVEALQQHGTWLSIHAAEALISLKRNAPVYDAFISQAQDAKPPYRIGVWRVLARSAPQSAQREQFVSRIWNVALDAAASDRTHAIEAVAKLGLSPRNSSERQCVESVALGASDAAPFAAWSLVICGDTRGWDRLAQLLQSDEQVIRLRAAAALGKLNAIPAKVKEIAEQALKREPLDSPARLYLMLAVDGNAARVLLGDPDPASRYIGAMHLASIGTRGDLPMLSKYIQDLDADVRVVSAFATLSINVRIKATTQETQSP